ncbi:MAG: hypothetical protein ACKO9H_11375, partial [Planctomycetota bacterium]
MDSQIDQAPNRPHRIGRGLRGVVNGQALCVGTLGKRPVKLQPQLGAKPGHEADLKKRTLTNLYNERPAWLDNAHKALDKAVAEAYGWMDYTEAMPDE